MHKKVCIGCGDTFVGNNEKELKKLLKVHWDTMHYHSAFVFGSTRKKVSKTIVKSKRLFQNGASEKNFVHRK